MSSNPIFSNREVSGGFNLVSSEGFEEIWNILEPPEEGSMYMDSNGNSIVYNNGEWHSIAGNMLSRQTYSSTTLSYNGDITVTHEIDISNSPRRMDILNKYHECRDCYNFSMAFGGEVPYIKKDDDVAIYVNSEENFEILKGMFVEHWNECHYDLIQKRLEMPKEEKEFEKHPRSTYLSALADRNLFGRSVFDTFVHDETDLANIPMIERIYGVDLIPSRKPNPNQHDQHIHDFRRREIRARNMDRNSRFRHRMRVNDKRY